MKPRAKKRQAPDKPKKQKIQVKEADGEVKVIGEYDPNTKTFTCKRKRSEHLMRKWMAWGLDAKAVDFLSKEQAIVHLKDTESKWEYKCEAIDFKIKGKLEEFHQHRPQYFLPLEEWEVVKANSRSMVIECLEKDCKHNFGNQCMRGVIRLGEKGECVSYEEKFE